jgi:hypothetical protein
MNAQAKSLSTPPAKRPALLPLWVALATAGFCSIAAGYRFTSEETSLFESMNVELPTFVQLQLDAGSWLPAGLLAVGIGIACLAAVAPREAIQKPLRPLAGALAGAAIAASLLVLVSSEIVFAKLTGALQQ